MLDHLLSINIYKSSIRKRKSLIIRIGSCSMIPIFHKNNRVLLIKPEEQKLKEGDIVCFTWRGMAIIHRIYRIWDDKRTKKRIFLTKADVTNRHNYPIQFKNIIGKAIIVYHKDIKFDLKNPFVRLWGQLLVVSFRINPGLSMGFHRLTLKLLKLDIIKVICKKIISLRK